jgi:hypothetical protein
MGITKGAPESYQGGNWNRRHAASRMEKWCRYSSDTVLELDRALSTIPITLLIPNARQLPESSRPTTVAGRIIEIRDVKHFLLITYDVRCTRNTRNKRSFKLPTSIRPLPDLLRRLYASTQRELEDPDAYSPPASRLMTASGSSQRKVSVFSFPSSSRMVTRRPGPFLGMYPVSQDGRCLRMPHPPQSKTGLIKGTCSIDSICALSTVRLAQFAEYP